MGKQTPFKVYRRQQAVISRRRLYPATLVYSAYFVVLLFFTLRSGHPLLGLLFAAGGVGAWTLLEYLSHRYVLHGRFPDGEGFLRRFLHNRLDPLHWEHHERPFDGLHINGTLIDTLPMFVVIAPLSLLAPVYTLPIAYAAFVQGYIVEEWIHHSVHFYDFRSRYFRYIKRHHWYHHTEHGSDLGYGLSSGFWDVIFETRYPDDVRRLLYGRRTGVKAASHGESSDSLNTYSTKE